MPGTYVKMAPVHLVHKFNPPITDRNVIFLATVWNKKAVYAELKT